MSTCDYCHEEFYSGGVSAVGVGTFCGHKCKVLKIHENAGLGTDLFYYRCKFCQSVLVTSIKSDRPERCRCSGSWMTFSHSVKVESKEEQTLFARGRVWNPHAEPPQPEPQPAREIPPLLTADKIEAKRSEKAAFRRAEEDRFENAYQQKETR